MVELSTGVISNEPSSFSQTENTGHDAFIVKPNNFTNKSIIYSSCKSNKAL